MKKNKTIFYIATGLMSAVLLMSAGMYIFNNEEIQKGFTSFNFPTWIIYPLAVAKILGVAALWVPGVPRFLKEWAYAGIFFNALLALGAHLSIADGEQIGAVIVLVLVLVSRYFLDRKEA